MTLNLLNKIHVYKVWLAYGTCRYFLQSKILLGLGLVERSGTVFGDLFLLSKLRMSVLIKMSIYMDLSRSCEVKPIIFFQITRWPRPEVFIIVLNIPSDGASNRYLKR